jgi:hypothetical protein
MNVPCGKCPKCLARKANAWAFRLLAEQKRSHSSDFITLTYDDDHLTYIQEDQPVLVKRDVQLFFKKLRKLQSQNLDWSHVPIKYFAVGEYGTNTLRPHYHLILINAHLPLIQSAWDKGQVHYASCTPASIAYTLKYMSKPPNPNTTTLPPEFRLMSKGLGNCYITPAIKAWHNNDHLNRMYLHTNDGKKIAMPRYYKDRIFAQAKRLQAANHHAQLNEKKFLDQQIADTLTDKHNRVQSHAAEFRKHSKQSLSKRNKL